MLMYVMLIDDRMRTLGNKMKRDSFHGTNLNYYHLQLCLTLAI